MNVRLLRRIAKAIVENPRQFDMDTFHKSKGYGSACVLADIPEKEQHSCNTTHCIAGFAQILSSKSDYKMDAALDARRLLDIDHVAAARLFYCDAWPEQFRGKKEVWKPTRKQAFDRIEHFIKTGGF